ncbi:MAG: hypothetical protein C4541_02270 [Candidatus Auribacter fodinae]|jgi:hypothetical protein|uniref:DUF6873 domain-containing protein n=1 Tax=Candidatus Auribacter fodinae TaxID=2093366 RepID=A0A3A4R563_9BACT|nr:MAG: hypothetical protein C4541_02270 [Candidatus Auribacter fodinae]
MNGFVICSPDLPEQMRHVLSGAGWEICAVPYCGSVHPALAGHPELQLCVLNHEEVIVHPDMDQNFLRFLYRRFKRVVVGQTRLRAEYPGDVPYNCKLVGELLIHNTFYTDPILMKRAVIEGFADIHVSQGYAGCSTLAVNESAIITADNGIALAAEMNDCDVLSISPGFIQLTGMNYGFIGGAAGWDGEHTVYFCGTLINHPDREKIKLFLKQYNIASVELSDEPLADYGSLFFIPSTQ